MPAEGDDGPQREPVFWAILRDGAWPWEERARLELNDVPELRHQKLEQLRQKLRSQAEDKNKSGYKLTLNLEENFLMPFLRTRKFDVEKAACCIWRYYELRLSRPDYILPIGKGPCDFPHVFQRPLATIIRQKNPIDGACVAVWSYRYFQPMVGNLEDMLTMSLYGIILAARDPAFQTHGAHLIVDVQGLTLSFCTMMLTKMYLLKALINAQASVPCRVCGVHLINDPWGFAKVVYRVVRPFMSEKIRNRLHFHGSGIGDLHEFISPEILPEEFGGLDGKFDAMWLKSALEDVHDEVVQNSYFGYTPLNKS